MTDVLNLVSCPQFKLKLIPLAMSSGSQMAPLYIDDDDDDGGKRIMVALDIAVE